jgi:putative ABC transport system ATP-binding protein
MLKVIINLFRSFVEGYLYSRENHPIRFSRSEEKTHSILTFIAEANNQPVKPSEVMETISHYRYRFPELNRDNYDLFLSEVAPHYSVRLHKAKKSLREIRDYVTPDSPFLILQYNDSPSGVDAYAIISYHAGGYKVVKISEIGEETWLTEKEIFQVLGIKTANDKLDWIISEPLYAFSNPIPPSVTASKLKNAIHQLFHLLRMERRDIWIIIIYGLGIGILSLIIPIATSSLVNIVSFGILLQPVIILTLLVAIFLGFAGSMQVIQTYVVEILQRRVFVRIATEFAIKFPKVKQEALDAYHKPELANRFFDTITIQKSVNSLLVDGLSVVITTIIGFLLIGIYHPVFLMFDFIILVIGGYFIVYKLGKSAGESYLKVSTEKFRVAAWIEEISRHTAIFHSKFGANFALEKADALTRDYIYARESYYKKLIKQIIGLICLQTVASALVLGIGGYLVIHRQLTIGQLVAAELVIAKVLSDIAKFGKHLDSFYSLIAAVDKIDKVFQLPVVKSGDTPYISSRVPIEVEISNIHYSLANHHSIFSDFSIKLSSKSITGISAMTPYDAHVLMDLISAIRVPSRGIISFDRQDIHETDYHLNHDESILVRGNEIFEGTILDNLRLGREEISQLEIREMLEKLAFWDIVQKMPQGLHSILLTFGHPFDNIQTSVIQLARAVLGKPRLLLIDGVLDSLPNYLLKAALEVLLNNERTWTLIVASRSDEVLSRMEQVLRLNDNDYSLKLQKRKGGIV